jgi:signal transduction histidine kinase
MAGVVAGDTTELEVCRLGGRYAAIGRTAVLACALAVAVYQTPSPPLFAIAAGLVGWSAIFLRWGHHGGVVAADTGIVALLCLTQPWTVPPDALPDSTNWVLAVVSITAVAHQWHTGVAAGSALTAGLIGSHLTGVFLADSAILPVAGPLVLWTFGEAALSRGLFLLVRAAARAADHELAVREQARRDAAVAAARRADEREYLSLLHDTAAATLLAVGTGMADGSEPWLRAQAARDLAALRTRREPPTGAADLVDLLEEVVRASRLTVELTAPDTVSMPAMPAAAIRGAVHEALANVARHAGVDAATLTVHHTGDTVTVEIADRGRGFVPEQVSPHRRGVSSSIVRRMDRVGGRADVLTGPGDGTTVRVVWPA